MLRAICPLASSTERLSPEMSSVPAVLVVDDERAVCRLMAKVLIDAGYRVLMAGSGEEALVIACQLGGRLAMVVTDVHMPGMDGTELAGCLSLLEPAPQVLFVVSSTGSPIGPPPGPFLLKPFQPADLTARVELMLGPAQALTSGIAG